MNAFPAAGDYYKAVQAPGRCFTVPKLQAAEFVWDSLGPTLARGSSAVVFQALQEGAAGYLAKDAKRAEIVEAVLDVAKGRTVVPAELAAGLAGEIRMRAKDQGPVLSERERQVLQAFARGLSVPQVAGELFIGVSTVKTHTQRLYEKLGVSDRAAAVAEGMRRGLVE